MWANKRMRNKMAGCIVLNRRIFGFDESMLKCLDLDGNGYRETSRRVEEDDLLIFKIDFRPGSQQQIFTTGSPQSPNQC